MILDRLQRFLSDKAVLQIEPELLYNARAKCTCGRFIIGCGHWLGIRSTWEHADDKSHTHPDGTLVEHA